MQIIQKLTPSLDNARIVKKRIAILGAGPSGLFMFKRLVESGDKNLEIIIFEKQSQWGVGMPYGKEGANDEHITNVSGNEIPTIVTSLEEWVRTAPKELLQHFNITSENFNDFKVVPRLLFGHYLAGQFALLQQMAEQNGISTKILLNTVVADLIDDPTSNTVSALLKDNSAYQFDHVIVCTGHNWPKTHEGKVSGYFDSPYPPAKLTANYDFPIAIRGTSLTAIDAIRTIARCNGSFGTDESGKKNYKRNPDSDNFRIVMHSRSGMLPAVRFHLEDSHLKNESLVNDEQVEKHRRDNDGFVSLDFLFDKNFKELLLERNLEFYKEIRALDMEGFVARMMDLREHLEPFQLLRAEYAEAEKSIKRKQSVHWKEILAVFSFSMNRHAKYLSAEDNLRLKQVLMPLIGVVIAFVPQSSCEELIALHDSDVLELIKLGEDATIEIKTDGGIIYHYSDEDNKTHETPYRVFVDCIGQPHFAYENFPFKSLLTQKTISPARLKFQSAQAGQELRAQQPENVTEDTDGTFYLKVPGIAINDHFQLIDEYGAYNDRIYMMAVPYIGGFNPDYSGLDFCEAASAEIIKAMV